MCQLCDLALGASSVAQHSGTSRCACGAPPTAWARTQRLGLQRARVARKRVQPRLCLHALVGPLVGQRAARHLVRRGGGGHDGQARRAGRAAAAVPPAVRVHAGAAAAGVDDQHVAGGGAAAAGPAAAVQRQRQRAGQGHQRQHGEGGELPPGRTHRVQHQHLLLGRRGDGASEDRGQRKGRGAGEPAAAAAAAAAPEKGCVAGGAGAAVGPAGWTWRLLMASGEPSGLPLECHRGQGLAQRRLCLSTATADDLTNRRRWLQASVRWPAPCI